MKDGEDEETKETKKMKKTKRQRGERLFNEESRFQIIASIGCISLLIKELREV